MDETAEFLEIVEQFLVASEMSPTAFGTDAVNDPNFVFDLRKKRNPNLRTVSKVKDFMRTRGDSVASVNHHAATINASVTK